MALAARARRAYNDEVLREFGFGANEIAALRKADAILEPQSASPEECAPSRRMAAPRSRRAHAPQDEGEKEEELNDRQDARPQGRRCRLCDLQQSGATQRGVARNVGRQPRILDDFAKDTDIRVVVLTGAGGKAFVSGADISKFESERSERRHRKYNATVERAYTAFHDFPKPTIAMIRGYCIGGGIGLAICCDMRICTDGSKFAVPAAKLGLGYG